ncbi:MAG: class I SAM-dependent methyltransferase [Saprospiraceae bacterium]|nr:class I SAM-dependent methyltransferase [Saprospiraceae bacterium]
MYFVPFCPVCNHSKFTKQFSCIDYTVSRSSFEIVQCEHCKLLLTSPRPENQELGKYYQSKTYISHSDSSEGLINKLYKSIRHLTLWMKLRWLKNLSDRGTLIDIGSGAGYFLNACKKQGYQVTGIEPDETTRNLSIEKFQLSCYSESYLEEIKNETADLITMWHVLEHVPEPGSRLQQINRILKDSGYLIIAVPNCDSFDAKYYREFWAGYDVPRHVWHFKPNQLIELAKHHQLECVEIKPMIFDAFYVSILSEKYKKNIFGLLLGGLIGMLSNINAAFAKTPKFSSQVYIFKKSKN